MNLQTRNNALSYKRIPFEKLQLNKKTSSKINNAAEKKFFGTKSSYQKMRAPAVSASSMPKGTVFGR